MDQLAQTGTPPRIRVIIVNYNGRAFLPRCFEALAAQTFAAFETVAVDNASTDGSAALALPDSRFRWLRLDRNLGFAAGNNAGATGFDGEWIVTLNPDAFPQPDWLERLMAAVDRHPGIAMLGSTQIDASRPDILDGSGDCFFALGLPWRGNNGHGLNDLPPEGEVFGPCAAAAAYSARRFHELGGFDERFFCYYEDVDLAFRMRLAGGRCIQVADAVVHHVGSGITGRTSSFVHFHSARNRVWLFVKNMPSWALWLLLPGHIVLNCALLAWGAKRGHGRAVLDGMIKAVAGLGPVWTDRRRVQAERKVSAMTLLTALCWSPLTMLRRRHDVRPSNGRSTSPHFVG